MARATILSLATLHDEDEVLPLLRSFHEASPYSGLEFNEIGVREAFRNAVEAEKTQSVVILARDEQNVCTGLIAALASTVPFLHGRIGLEWAWWVSPDHRKGRTGIQLLDAYEYWCRFVADCQYSQVSDLLENSLEKFYTRRGYVKTEQAYIRTL